MLMSDVLKCSFSFWYPIFESVTIQSDIIKLDTQITDWLLADGIVLPKACLLEMDGNNDDEDDDPESAPPEFPQLEAAIRQSIDKYRHVFPKLNWSAPEDAKWIQASGTKCNTLSEVFLLLKSSDKIVHDLTQAFEKCSDFSEATAPVVEYELVLRKWENINPSMEFRVFVVKDAVMGICQRDVRSFYSHLQQYEEQIKQDILRFFREQIRGKFPVECYVLDVYRPAEGQMVLIDINPFGESTDSLLFDWEELNSMINNHPPRAFFLDFRYVQEQLGVQPNRLEMNSLPIDLFNGNLQIDDFRANLSNGS